MIQASRVIVALHGARDVQAEGTHLHAHGLSGDPEHARGIAMVALRELQSAGEEQPVYLAERLRVDIARLGCEPVADERVQIERPGVRRGRRGLRWESSGRKAGSRTLPEA